MRIIPATMATQHPDNAGKPYWHDQPYISAVKELEDCYRSFADFGIEEYNWDWEGKFADEAVIERLFHDHADFFYNHPIGKEFFLTFRVPNPRVEKQHRLARAFMVMLTAASLARFHNFHTPPLFEIILPLTETSEDMIDLVEAFREMASLKHKLLDINGNLPMIEIIPLFEQVEKMMSSSEVLERYISLHKQKFSIKPSYIRPYCARSDPALNSGLIPTILAIKVALSSYLDVEEKEKVVLFPIIGAGSLPFRGGLTPNTVKQFVNEYRGIRTTTIQSGYRYDYEKKDVISSINYLNTHLSKVKQKHLTTQQIRLIKEAVPLFLHAYRSVVEQIAPFIHDLALQTPKRRERHLHIGLFGYSRGIGKVRLPRAIPFTAVLYSFGVPPELIGSGRGLKEAKASGLLPTVEQTYLNLKEELIEAGRYINKENLAQLAKEYPAFAAITKDVEFLEDYLGTTLQPKTEAQKKHYQLTAKTYAWYKQGKKIGELITQSGVLRKSIG